MTGLVNRAWRVVFDGGPLSKADLEKRYALDKIQKFEAVLNRHGRSLRQFSSILDFGCNRGRLAAPLFSLLPGARISGCDVMGDAIEACRQRHPRGHFFTNNATPPLNFPDKQYDLIFSYSVFTHLSEPNHKAWLKEHARLLNPGGVLLHTTHSYECLRRLLIFSPESIEKYMLPEPTEDFIRSQRGYYYVPDNPSTPEYGLTIISEEYLRTVWPKESGLKLLDVAVGAVEAYPEGCQDIVVLVKET